MLRDSVDTDPGQISAEGSSSGDQGRLLLETLLRVMRDLRMSYDAKARDIGLTFSRARALSTLSGIEGASQAELAQALGIEPPTLKRQIDALEAEGFIERRAREGDVRKHALFLTDLARAAPTTGFIDRSREALTAGISTEEQVIVRRVLERLALNIAELADK